MRRLCVQILPALLVLSAACSSTQSSPSDAGQVPYWQWYYPQCGTPGSCDNPSCQPVQLDVGPADVCEYPSKTITTGCVPVAPTSDWYLYATSTHELIATLRGPYTEEGVSSCMEDGVVLNGGKCCAWIDGGGPRLLP